MKDEELVAYYHDIYVYAYSLSKSPHEAEDIAQETMLKAISNISSFDGRKDIRAWLFTIARKSFTTRSAKTNVSYWKTLVLHPFKIAEYIFKKHSSSTNKLSRFINTCII